MNTLIASRDQHELTYRADIDGLRAVAITSVVAYHIDLPWAHGGFIGVDVFFVISGYLIGSMVYREIRTGRFSILQFYRRRAKRILPALFVVLGFGYVAAILLLSPHEAKVFAAEALTALASSSNIFYSWLASDYFSPDTKFNPLLMTWSLGVEEQFYILFPLLMFLLRKANWLVQFSTLALLASLSFAANVWGATHSPVFTFFLLPTRFWELAAGVLLGIAEANRPLVSTSAPLFIRHSLSILGLLLIGMSIVTLDHSRPIPSYAGLLPVTGAILLIGTQGGVVNWLLSLKPIRTIGLLSYSWYLWHWPLLSFARLACRQEMRNEVGMLIGIASLGFAALSFKFVELPFRNSKTPAPLLLRRYACVTLAMMLPPILLYASHGLPQRNRSAQMLDMATSNLGADKCMVQSPVAHPKLTASCASAGAGPAVALIGDSHAAALATALREVAGRSHFRLIEFTKGFCTAAGASPDQPLLERECAEFNRELEDYLEKDQSVHTVFLAGFWSLLFPVQNGCSSSQTSSQAQNVSSTDRERYALLSNQIDSVITRLEAAHKIVYLVQDSPHFSFNPMRFMRTELIEPRRELANILGDDSQQYLNGMAPDCSLPGDSEARELILNAASRDSRVRVVDLYSALCNASTCRFTSGDQVLFIDNNHLSLRGAQIALSGLQLPEMASSDNRDNGMRPLPGRVTKKA